MEVRARKIALYAKLCGYAAGVFVSPLFYSAKAAFLLFRICWRQAFRGLLVRWPFVGHLEGRHCSTKQCSHRTLCTQNPDHAFASHAKNDKQGNSYPSKTLTKLTFKLKFFRLEFMATCVGVSWLSQPGSDYVFNLLLMFEDLFCGFFLTDWNLCQHVQG